MYNMHKHRIIYNSNILLIYVSSMSFLLCFWHFSLLLISVRVRIVWVNFYSLTSVILVSLAAKFLIIEI